VTESPLLPATSLRHQRDLATLTLSVNPSRPTLLGRRQSLRSLHHWNTRERRCILVAGHLDVETWNTALEITGTPTSLPEQQAVSDEAVEPQTRRARLVEQNQA
jgi:hypothetical protein